MPILFDVVSDLGDSYRVATVRALPGTLAGAWDPSTRKFWQPDLSAVREALPHIHRKAFDRAGRVWFCKGPRGNVEADTIGPVSRAVAVSRATHATMSLYDRRGRRIRSLYFRPYHSGPVTQSNGRQDSRYSYDLENCGQAAPCPVVRFCGDYVGSAPGGNAQAQAIAWRHALDRLAAIREGR